MSSRRLLTLPLCLAAFCAVTPVADAARKFPTVAKVTPTQAAIGETMTIKGRGYRRGPRKNTIVFKRDGKPAVFVKADTATPRRLVVILPEKLREHLASRQGAKVATRFRLRILAKRLSRRYTKLDASPTILPGSPGAPAPKDDATTTVTSGTALAGAAAGAPGTTGSTGDSGGTAEPPADCDGDGLLDIVDSDDDGDLLTDSVELALRTNRCDKDTDGDGMEDGWEYKSAFDLNRSSCPTSPYPTPCEPAIPYPGKRPYPNPLDGTDANYDFDGDLLPAWAEHKASLRHGRTIDELWYSDGLKASIDTSPSTTCRGMAVPAVPSYLGSHPHYSLDSSGNGCLDDSERDEDNDALDNHTELRGSLSRGLWQAVYKEPEHPLPYQGTDWLDSDSDGDTVIDGVDDQDNDDFWNVEEVYRGLQSVNKLDEDAGYRSGLWVDAFNPCLPSPDSRTCPPAIAAGEVMYRPFVAVDATRDEWPKPRWPLYGTSWFNGPALAATTPEIWNGIPDPLDQTLPPAHPLIPRPGF